MSQLTAEQVRRHDVIKSRIQGRIPMSQYSKNKARAKQQQANKKAVAHNTSLFAMKKAFPDPPKPAKAPKVRKIPKAKKGTGGWL